MAQLSPEAEFQLRRSAARLRAREERRSDLLEAAERAAAMLRDEFGATRVWRFGSLDRAWFHEGSDVDLACCLLALAACRAFYPRSTALRKSALSSGRTVLMNIPDPSSKPARVETRGTMLRYQWKNGVVRGGPGWQRMT